MADELQDISKLKVADLKKELKARGLSTMGNKNELIERLQLSLHGENSLITEPDSAAGDSEEILDEDDVLADEEEEEVLVGDISPAQESKLRKLPSVSEDEGPVSTKRTATGTTKKIVLNRNVVPSASSSEKENQQQGISQEDSDTGQQPQKPEAEGKKVVKLSAFSMKERLEMRAQKFGVELSSDAKKEARAARFGISAPINTSNTAAASSDVLRKRAERFGLTLSPVSTRNLSKAELTEKLEKRKQRFGVADSTNGKKSVVSSSTLDEKKRQRAERFKLAK
ncbi:SAP domain-containing ribonucleoprotein isoform X1 [Periplaneta americana]|uniref:SAP domain-containing ribonucleoprotein isoform X1 n=1 Tax=Periplaneta americana TaxID=6978 RepID=UPI0037E73B09